MKKSFGRSILTVVLLAVLVVAGFGTMSEAKPDMVLRMAGQQTADHMATRLMKQVAEEVKEKTDGRIEIKVYPTSQLGDYVLVYEEMIRGTIDMALTSVPSQFDPRLELPYVNYYIRNYDDVKNVYKAKGWLYNKMDEFHGNLGVKFLGFNVEGFGGFGMTKEINKPLDPTVNKDVLLRVCSIQAFKLAAEDGGYSTVTIPYAELYTALQTGVADGWSGGSPVHSYLFFKDVLKYYYQVNNFVESESYMMSKVVWNKLSEEDQKIISEACARAANDSIRISQEEDSTYMDKLRDAGIEVITYTDEELDPLFEHCQKVTWPRMEKLMTKELMDEFRAEYAEE